MAMTALIWLSLGTIGGPDFGLSLWNDFYFLVLVLVLGVLNCVQESQNQKKQVEGCWEQGYEPSVFYKIGGTFGLDEKLLACQEGF
jgi:hypothetical protein